MKWEENVFGVVRKEIPITKIRQLQNSPKGQKNCQKLRLRVLNFKYNRTPEHTVKWCKTGYKTLLSSQNILASTVA